MSRALIALVPSFQDEPSEELSAKNALENAIRGGVILHTVIDVVGVDQRLVRCRIRGSLAAHEDKALIFLRRELALHPGRGYQQINPNQNHRGKNCGEFYGVERGIQPLPVTDLESRESFVDESGRAILPTGIAFIVRLQQSGAHHWRKRQGHNGRNQDRADKRKGKLREKRAGQSALKSDWNIDRNKHGQHCNDGDGEFARSNNRRLKRRHTFIDVTAYIFHDDNRIIDH